MRQNTWPIISCCLLMYRALWILFTLLLLSACSSAPYRTGGLHWTSQKTAQPKFIDHSAGNEEISLTAMSLIDVPYRWGGNTTQSGFDCSGFVRYVMARATNIQLPRTAREMGMQGERVAPEQIAPGDLIFFNTNGRANSHIGIYVGRHRFINAPSSGGTVRIDRLDRPYWARHFTGIRRIAVRRKPIQTSTPVSSPMTATHSPTAVDSAQSAVFDTDDPIARLATDD